MIELNLFLTNVDRLNLSFGFVGTCIYIYIEWASARVPPTPLKRRGGAAGAG